MKVINVVGAAIIKDDNVMIAKRMKGDLAGLWEFPGGKIEPNETPEEALKREILEEMELHINVCEHFTTAEWDYPTFHLSMKCYICSLIDEEIHLHDHTAIQWFNIKDDINKIDWVPADVQVIESLQELYKK